MSRPLPPGDPAQVGPFRLSARLSESAAGIVFLGVDGEGRRASVAVLNRGAAEDAAARDRFRAAINAAVPGAGGAGAGRGGAGDGGGAPVVAAQPDGPAPWVATAYEADGPGAERFLEPVVLGGSRRWGRRRGPQFQPHWLGSSEAALARPRPEPVVGPVAAPERPPERSLVAAVLALAAALVVLVLLLAVLFACQPRPKDPPPEPPEPTPSVAPSAPPSVPQQPGRPSPPPSSGSPSPSPSGSGGGGDGGPL
ncbi:hypothetical protein [Actinomadura nitritigenes]|uniref:Serine/threonine protein kinase n=1 Tax=Actinomadura nitritigenes TaxID=134602 RepID=A0ABS3R3H9_9ACTN|nr:hypothetical protein [Actinomadura nitritigenes]MBO2440816.1 hypothetical protein [Actinomadura nitritigenes]